MIFQDLNNITDIYNKTGLAIQRMYNQTGDIIWEKSIFDIYDVTTDPYYTQYFTITPTNNSKLTISGRGYYKYINETSWHSFYRQITIENPIYMKSTMTGTNYPSIGIDKSSGVGTYDVSGNTMSLFYGDDFIGKNVFPNNEYMPRIWFLFRGGAKLINAENLILPSMDLSALMYQYMFRNFYYLETAPKILPAMNLSEWCYSGMFQGCISLKKAPLLPAKTLVNGCYRDLFLDCTKLNYIKCLAENNINTEATLNGWVGNVSETGTFIKSINSQWNRYLPAGNWTIISE